MRGQEERKEKERKEKETKYAKELEQVKELWKEGLKQLWSFRNPQINLPPTRWVF